MAGASIQHLDASTRSRLQRALDGKLKQISLRPASSFDDADLEVITTALSISATESLDRRDGSSSKLLLLKLVVRLAKAGRSLSTVELIDVIFSFPRHSTAIRRHILVNLLPSALSEMDREVIQPLLHRLETQANPQAIYALELLAKSFTTIAGMILSSPVAPKALNAAYVSLQESSHSKKEVIWCKSHILLLLHSLLGNLPLPEQEWKLAMLDDDSSPSSSRASARPLVNASLVDDYATFFRQKGTCLVGEEELQVLRSLQGVQVESSHVAVDSKVSRRSNFRSRTLC